MKSSFIMKVIFTAAIASVLLINFSATAQTSRALSNLTAPTAINQSLLPNSHNTQDLGSGLKAWKDVYISNKVFLNGYLSIHAPGTANFFSGSGAGNSTITGQNNTGVGKNALANITSGSFNAGNGAYSLYSNNTGTSNTANGYSTLRFNKSGFYNTATGFDAMHYNTTGFRNTATGAEALLSNTTGSFNTATGQTAMYRNTTGKENTANGNAALFSNSTGSYNTASGSLALYQNTTGSYNTANGYNALGSNTIGSQNTATGSSALYSNKQGFQNTANGSLALYYNENGYGNTANGANSLHHNTSGFSNTSNGSSALYNNTTGEENVAQGAASLYSNISGSRNNASGRFALYSNTHGYGNNAYGYYAMYSTTLGSENTALGHYAFYQNVTGSYNTATGSFALKTNSTGQQNTAIGMSSLAYSTTGFGNTAIGAFSMKTNISGSQNIALGHGADVLYSNLTNATAIGYNVRVDASNKVRIGNSFVTSIGGQVGWTTFSDGRYKRNIKSNVSGLSFINKLEPVTYTVDTKSLLDHFNGRAKNNGENDEAEKAALYQSAEASSKIIQDGFVAQDVEAVATSLGFEFSGVDKPQSKDGLYGLRYDKFVVPLVKAVQELSAINDEQNLMIDSLQQQLNELRTMVLKLNNQLPGLPVNTSMPGVLLEQNQPNPFSQSTLIRYQLPLSVSGQLKIFNASGAAVKTMFVSGSGQAIINAGELSAGTYTYSIYVNGKPVISKRMIVIK